ncbi:MAG: hypothetical protein JNL82_37850 [Myxococcales bacterium]|nr:hypothetical protein [Myxococcales bacterium]
MRSWPISNPARLRLSLLACPLLACSFDATGQGSAGQSASGSETTADVTSTTNSPTSSDPDETSSGPTDPPTTAPDDTTAPPPTTEDTSSGTTTQVDPGTTTLTTEASAEASSSSGPPPPGCGDGAVDEGEMCDDGNDVETDECLSNCVPASCGDGQVHAGVEACDDGNMDETDACTSMCAPPACDDQAQNGDESDVDCGGACKGCELGGACGDMNDCASKFCDDGECVPAPNCAALKSMAAATGPALIDPDGAADGQPFMVWCDQDTQGGGWTLVLKADGSKSNFSYTSARWTEAAEWMPDPDMDRTETKLRSYAGVPVDEVLVQMEAPIQGNGPLMLKSLVMNVNDAASLHAAISPGTFQMYDSPDESAWRGLMPDNGSLQDNCMRRGLNAQSTDNASDSGRVRIGIIANNEDDCQSPNSWIGVGGATLGMFCNNGKSSTVGNRADCMADANVDTKAFAFVFVR